MHLGPILDYSGWSDVRVNTHRGRMRILEIYYRVDHWWGRT
jgi:hypothetical protein